MAQDWRTYGALSMCMICTRGLTSEMCIRCPYCSVNTCAPCSNVHRQIHDNLHDRYSNQQMPSQHYQPHGYLPQQVPQFPPPPPSQSHPQYSPQQSRYFPPPPRDQSLSAYSFHQGQHFPAPPNAFPTPGAHVNNGIGASPYPSLQTATVPRTGHRNWIAAAVDKGSELAKHKTTKKILKKGAKLGVIAGGIAVGVNLTDLVNFDSGDSFNNDAVSDSSALPSDDSAGASSGGSISPAAAGMAAMNSAAYYAPLLACSSMQ